jgi:hypothetical protein
VEAVDDAADDGAFSASSFATMPAVRGDGNGTVFVVWRKRVSNVRWDLYAWRFAGGAWGPETLIDPFDLINNNTTSVFNPALGINGSGVAVATWYYSGSAPDVYANLFK